MCFGFRFELNKKSLFAFVLVSIATRFLLVIFRKAQYGKLDLIKGFSNIHKAKIFI